ncbi:tRNA sulfurtransferase [Halobium salinum]|uniref:Probable tRNA sulfurtransferase n=1 Tax=Halobium salinum TaxID=1364940 RepID=A0ABD5PDC3_9EURY|nr:tRNA sulfurtransferase [Halobium salinum]
MHRPDAVLVRYGEVGVKSSKVRTDMERRLRDNLEAALATRDIDGTVERNWSRLRIDTPDPDAAADAAADTFGVVSASPVVVCEPTREALLSTLRAAAADHPGGSFAVDANRAGPDGAHPFTSRELEAEGGSVVENVTGAPVDLDDPAVTYGVDCREDEAFVFTERRPGPGGLPLGTQEPVVVLLSGGLDSPVAAWELMKRGAPVYPVYVDLGDYGGPDHCARAVEVTERLARFAAGFDTRLRVVDAGALVDDLVASVRDTRMLSLRRAMLRMGEVVARDLGAVAVATGESLGQKSSQTGTNLAVTDAAATLPVYRPLLTRDKSDITEQARRIGTFADSTLPVGCERVAPAHPETGASLATVEAAEPDDLLERAVRLARNPETVDAGADGGRGGDESDR